MIRHSADLAVGGALRPLAARYDDGRESGSDRAGDPGRGPARGARPAPEHKEPYRTLSVLSVAVGLIVVPVISLLGHRRLAIICLGTGVLLLALLRLQRPDGTWIAARGRFFDVVFGTLLAVALFALTYYADLPRVV